jgi:hypothetical protein
MTPPLKPIDAQDIPFMVVFMIAAIIAAIVTTIMDRTN